VPVETPKQGETIETADGGRKQEVIWKASGKGLAGQSLVGLVQSSRAKPP
jgi:hypothetical protein